MFNSLKKNKAMNKKRRNSVKDLLDRIKEQSDKIKNLISDISEADTEMSTIYDELSLIKEEEEECYGNMPDTLKECDRGIESELAIDELEAAMEAISNIREYLSPMCSNYEESTKGDFRDAKDSLTNIVEY